MKRHMAVKLINDLWTTDALQGRGRLARRLPNGDTEFCCLGRACVVAGTLTRGTRADGVFNFQGELGDVFTDVLPPSVQKKFGFRTSNGGFQEPIYIGARGFSTLAAMNDAGVPFKSIAQVIADHWRTL